MTTSMAIDEPCPQCGSVPLEPDAMMVDDQVPSPTPPSLSSPIKQDSLQEPLSLPRVPPLPKVKLSLCIFAIRRRSSVKKNVEAFPMGASTRLPFDVESWAADSREVDGCELGEFRAHH